MHSPHRLLETYQEELQLIHQLMGEFAKRHPKIAARLRLNQQGVSDDQQMGYLMEAFALSAAKARFHLDDEFSEISDALLENLHPHAMAPIPALSLIEFKFDPQKLTRAHLIPSGSTLLTDPIQEQRCVFQTCYPVHLLPLTCTAANLMEKPLQAPIIPALIQAESVLRLQLSCTIPTLVLADLHLTALRFFIRAKANEAHALYELLFNHTLEIILANSVDDAAPIQLNKACLKAVGFADTDGILPYGQQTSMGYRLLTEFFAFTEKFLFFEISSIAAAIQQKFKTPNEKIEFYFYLNKSSSILTKKINADFFALHCTPIVNLFEQSCDQFLLQNTKYSYTLNPNMRKSVTSAEIYRIEQVTATLDDQKSIPIWPFHQLNHQQAHYYHIERKPAWYFGYYPVTGSEVELRFSNLNNEPLMLENWKILAQVLCTNRDLPALLTAQHKQKLALEQKIEGIEEARCLIPFTHTHHPFLKPKYKWRYISHMALDFLWCASLDEGALFLHSLLDLYEFDAEKQRCLRKGLLDIYCKNTHRIRPGGHGTHSLWHGVEVILLVDASQFEKIGLYLFCCVMDRFLPIFATTQFYTQLIVKEGNNVLYEFSPRCGEKPIV